MEETIAKAASSTPSSTPESEEESESTPPATPAQPSPKHSGGKMMWIIVLILLFVGVLVVAAWYFPTQLQKTSIKIYPTPRISPLFPKELIACTEPQLSSSEFFLKRKIHSYY